MSILDPNFVEKENNRFLLSNFLPSKPFITSESNRRSANKVAKILGYKTIQSLWNEYLKQYAPMKWIEHWEKNKAAGTFDVYPHWLQDEVRREFAKTLSPIIKVQPTLSPRIYRDRYSKLKEYMSNQADAYIIYEDDEYCRIAIIDCGEYGTSIQIRILDWGCLTRIIPGLGDPAELGGYIESDILTDMTWHHIAYAPLNFTDLSNRKNLSNKTSVPI